MITDSAALILFAIRSAVKLGRQIRLAYVDATRRRDLTLPLPDFFSGTNVYDACEYFSKENLGLRFVQGYEWNGKRYPPNKRLAALLAKCQAGNMTAPEEAELKDLHIKYRNVGSAEEGGLVWQTDGAGKADPEEIYALLSVQQWQRGADPTPSTLHRVSGTLIEIGIDYALTSPDLFDKNSKKGKAIAGFLSALDTEIDFKEGDLSEIPGRLFVAILETTADNSALMSGDPKIQEFVQVTTSALSKDMAERLNKIDADANLPADEKREARLCAKDWAELLFRTTLSSGGRLVLSDPARFLGVKDAAGQVLITAVGNSLLDLIMTDNGGLQKALSREGLETVLQAALKAVSEHPEIMTLTKNAGVKVVLVGLAKDLSQTDNLLSADIFPELARLVLENTAKNIDLFWPDLKNHPEKNLVATAVRATLAILSRPAAEKERWRLRFGRAEILLVTDTVLHELTANPGWLLNRAGELGGTLEAVLSATLNALRQRADCRLSPALAADILCATLKTVALRKEFGNVIDGRPVVDVTLGGMAKYGLDQAAVARLSQVLGEEIRLIEGGARFDLDKYAAALQSKLAA